MDITLVKTKFMQKYGHILTRRRSMEVDLPPEINKSRHVSCGFVLSLICFSGNRFLKIDYDLTTLKPRAGDPLFMP